MKRTLWVCLAVLLTGCASIQVSHDYDKQADFSNLRTYDWAGPQPVTGNPRLDNDILHSRIRSAVERELAAKGFQKMAGPSPDFKVAYHVALEDKIDVTTFDYYDYTYPAAYHPHQGFVYQTYGSAWPRSETYVFQYEEGTLLLDIIDPKTKQMIWRGIARAEVNVSDSPEKKEARVNKAVNKLLKTFPA